METVIPMVMGVAQQLREIREDQIRHGLILDRLQQQGQEKVKSSSRSPIWALLLKPIGAAGVKYIVAIAMVDYLLKGGDIISLLNALTASASTLAKLL